MSKIVLWRGVDTLAAALYGMTDDMLKEHFDLAPWRPQVGVTPVLRPLTRKRTASTSGPACRGSADRLGFRDAARTASAPAPRPRTVTVPDASTSRPCPSRTDRKACRGQELKQGADVVAL